MSAKKSQSVIVVGVHSTTGAEHAAIITNVFPALSSDVGFKERVNLSVFPDGGAMTLRTSVPFYDNLQEANEAKAKLPFCYPP
jgi:hypothetical protein